MGSTLSSSHTSGFPSTAASLHLLCELPCNLTSECIWVWSEALFSSILGAPCGGPVVLGCPMGCTLWGYIMALGWPKSPEWLLVTGQPIVFSQDGSANSITVPVTKGWKVLSCFPSLASLSHTWPLVSVLFLATTVMLSKGQSGHDTSLYKTLRSLPATTRIKSEFLPMATGPAYFGFGSLL